MRQITPQEFLVKVESGDLAWKGTIGRRVYGVEELHDKTETGKIREVLWADVP